MLFYHFILFGGWVHAFFSSWECLFLYITTFIVLIIRLVHYIKKIQPFLSLFCLRIMKTVLRAFANRWANCLQFLTILTKFEPNPYHNVTMYWGEAVQRHLSGIYINKQNPFKFKWHNKFIFFYTRNFGFIKLQIDI